MSYPTVKTHNFKKLLRISAIFACLLAVNPTMLVQAKSKNADIYISSADLKARDGYQLKVPGRGVFQVIGVEHGGHGEKECKIDSASLIALILASDFRAPKSGYAAKKRSIKMKAEQQGDEIVCSGSGEGCTVIIAVWDPDDPVLPE